jgi:LysM repeat protein/ABC-type branched-subunit amino acid transport system substrate-binding protein
MGIIIVTFNSMKKIAFIFLLVLVSTSAFAQNCKNYHVVATGETLYRISRIYGITIAEIQALNPGLVTTVKLGEHICLPNSVKPIRSEVSTVYPENDFVIAVEGKKDTSRTSISSKKDSYAIALLLPFSTYQMSNDSLDERSVKLRNVAVNMYRGAMMAQQELQNRNVNATIYLLDVGNSVEVGKIAVDRLEEIQADVVVGPLFKEPIQEVVKWVSKRNSHMVVPVKMSNKILLLSDHMSKAYPGNNSQWYYLSGFAKDEFPNSIIVGAYAKGKDDFSNEAAMSGFLAHGLDSLKTFDVSENCLELYNFIKKAKKHVVVLDMTSEEKTGTALTTALTGLNVNFVGGESNASESRLEQGSKNVATKNITLDYYNLDNLKWIASYRKEFQSEPDEFSAIMHDIVLYYGTGLQLFGTDVGNHLNEIDQSGLVALGFDFFKTGPESGYENAFVNVVQKMNGRWGLKNNLK